MFLFQLTMNMILFFLGLNGLVLNKQNILSIFISIELLLLSLNLNFVNFSIYLNDFYGQLFSFFILTIAAAESAIGLALIILFYRTRGSILTHQNVALKY